MGQEGKKGGKYAIIESEDGGRGRSEKVITWEIRIETTQIRTEIMQTFLHFQITNIPH